VQADYVENVGEAAQRVKAKAGLVKGVIAQPVTEWLKPGLIARVRYLKGGQKSRHATLQDVGECEGYCPCLLLQPDAQLAFRRASFICRPRC
jgi:hypothetical protein